MTSNRNRVTVYLPIVIIAMVIAAIALSRQKDEVFQTKKGMTFGTTYSVIYQSSKTLDDEIEKALKDIDFSLSMFNKESVISHINNNEPVTLDKHFLTVFTKAKEVNKESFGAFDITVAPVVNAWGFGFKSGEMPTDQTIDSLKSIIGFDKVELKDGKVIKRDKRAMLDCSAIAKGYGVDVVADVLRSHGVKNFMVEIGGEIVTSGINSKRMPWRIGVVKPTDDSLNIGNELQTCINVTDKAMATSGNYRNFYYKGGKKYAHTIDPKTCRPVQHNILSATVIADDCATADAYATSFMVLGLEDTKKVLNKHPELMVYLIYSDEKGNNAVWYSPSMKDKIDS